MSNFDQLKFEYARYYPIIGLRVRGALGHLFIFKEYWYGRRVDKYYVTSNPRTSKQQGNRSIYYDAVKNWQSFDDLTKRYYNTIAKRFKLYGYHKYLQFYLNAHKPMIIYWGNLAKSAIDASLITDVFLPLAGGTMTGATKIDVNSATALVVEDTGAAANFMTVDTTNGYFILKTKTADHNSYGFIQRNSANDDAFVVASGRASVYSYTGAGGVFTLHNRVSPAVDLQLSGHYAFESYNDLGTEHTTAYLLSSVDTVDADAMNSSLKLGIMVDKDTNSGHCEPNVLVTIAKAGMSVPLPIWASGIDTSTTGAVYSLYMSRSFRPATDTATGLFMLAARFVPTYTSTYNATAGGSFLAGGFFNPQVTSSGVTNLRAGDFLCSNSGSGTVPQADGVRIRSAINSGGGAITLVHGLNIESQTVGVTNYALKTNAGHVVFNYGGDASTDFTVKSDSYDALFIDASENSIDIMHHASGKIGFFAAAPATRQAHIIDADGNLADITTKFNTLLSYFETYGLLASA